MTESNALRGRDVLHRWAPLGVIGVLQEAGKRLGMSSVVRLFVWLAGRIGFGVQDSMNQPLIPSTEEAQTQATGVQGQPWLHSKFEAILG